MRVFLISLIFSFSTFATTWSDLEEGKSYKLSQSFQLPLLERSRSLLDFNHGEMLKLKKIEPMVIPGAQLTLYIFDYNNCPGPELKTDMVIVPVKDSSPLVEAGAQMENCELNIFIETKDTYYKSLFE